MSALEPTVTDPTQQVQDINLKEQVQEETPEQINWKKFREERNNDRKQKLDAEKRAAEKAAEAEALKKAMEAIVNKPSKQYQEPDQEQQESEDERIEKKVLAALQAKEQQFHRQRQEQEQQELPHKLTQTYSDFNNVCSTENLDYLEYHYPEIARAFQGVPEGFQKWSDIYKAVKKLVPNPDSKRDQGKAEKNLNKPQSISVGGTTQTGDGAPVYLDDQRRSDNWKRMQRIMKGG